MRRLVFALFILLVPCALHAQTLDVVISDPTVFVDFDNSGPAEVDLEFLFQIDFSAALVGQGPNNGDLFSNLSYTVTSNILGLNGVAATNLLDFELNPDQPIGSTNDGFLLFNSGTTSVNGVSGFGGVLNAFDGQSSLLVTGGSGPTTSGTGGLQTSLVNGSLIGGSIFNFNDTTVSFTAAVPEPSSLVLLTGLASTWLCRRKRRSSAI